MAYDISWYHPERVIYLDVIDNFTIDELAESIKFIEEAVRTTDSRIHLIVDVRAVKSIPSNVLEIKKRVTYLDRDHMGWMLLIGANPLVSTFVKVLTQLMGTKYQSFKGLKPALEFLAGKDESLADLVNKIAE